MAQPTFIRRICIFLFFTSLAATISGQNNNKLWYKQPANASVKDNPDGWKSDPELLPALPDAWKDGSIKGLKARDGFEISMQWKNNTLTTASIAHPKGGVCKIKYNNKVVDVKVSAGKTLRVF